MQSYYDWTFTERGSEDEQEKGKIYSTAYFKLFPLASDDFIRAAMAFHTYAWLNYPNFAEEENRNTFEELWTNLVVQMRDDAIVQSDLTRQEISTHLPWYWGAQAQKD